MTDWKAWQKEDTRKTKEMETRDLTSKSSNSLVGRYIREPFADSYAYYEIVKENKTTVKIKHIAIGDAWTIPYWGKSATVKRVYAVQNVKARDFYSSIFNERTK